MKTARWNYAVPVRGPLVTAPLVFFSALAAHCAGVVGLAAVRRTGIYRHERRLRHRPSGKRSNVMTLTALGSSALAVGMTTWIFNQRQLHVIMRAALSSSILFYATGMFALGFDVGRPWNFYHVLIPVALELAQCAPGCLGLHDRVRIDFPALREPAPPCCRNAGSTASNRSIRTWSPSRFLLPAMHQSSLGSLMVVGGTKVHPLCRRRCLPASI